MPHFLIHKNTEEKKYPFYAIVCTMTFFFRSFPISCEIISFYLVLYYSERFIM